MISPENLEYLLSISQESDTDDTFVFHKMVEEMGELSTARNQPERADETDVSEAIDLLIATLDYLNKQSTPEYVNLVFNAKLRKWHGLTQQSNK